MYEKRYNIPLDKLKAKRAFEHMSHVHQFRWILSPTGHRYTHIGFLQRCRIVNGFCSFFTCLVRSTKMITIRNSVWKILTEEWGKNALQKNKKNSLWKIIALHYPEIKMEHAVGEPFCDIKCQRCNKRPIESRHFAFGYYTTKWKEKHIQHQWVCCICYITSRMAPTFGRPQSKCMREKWAKGMCVEMYNVHVHNETIKKEENKHKNKTRT